MENIKIAPSYKLVIDTRERKVINHTVLAQINYEIAQIKIGDYQLCDVATGVTIAIFERKTFQDYASSIIDGRKNNTQKMLDARKQNERCRLFYIVEGPAFPDVTTKFANMEYYKIESSMFHLMMRDNIFIWRTRDESDTLETLIRFMASVTTLDVKYRRVEKEGDAVIENKKQIVGGEWKTSDRPLPGSDEDIVCKMWGCISGISYDSSVQYAKLTTLKMALTLDAAAFDAAQVAENKKRNMRFLSAPVIAGLQNPNMKAIIAEIPRFSKDAVQALLLFAEATRKASSIVEAIFALDEATFADIKYKQTKMGKARYQSFHKYFNMQVGGGGIDGV